MLPLHKIPPVKNEMGEIKKYSLYAQIKKDFVYVTNAYALVKVPCENVFGSEAAALPVDNRYFPLDLWKNGKFDKASEIQVAGEIIRAIDKKGSVTGEITLISDTDLEFKYPNCDGVLPVKDDFEYQAVFDPSIISYTLASFGGSNDAVLRFRTTATGPRAMSLMPPLGYEGIEAIVMPQFSEKYHFGKPDKSDSDETKTESLEVQELKTKLKEKDDEIETLEDELNVWKKDEGEKVDSLNEQIEELENLTAMQESVTTGNGDTLHYRLEAGNVQDAQILELFTKCLAEVKPLELIAGLETILKYKVVF